MQVVAHPTRHSLAIQNEIEILSGTPTWLDPEQEFHREAEKKQVTPAHQENIGPTL